MPAKLDPELVPYMPLSEKLGTFASQLGRCSAGKIEIHCMGELSKKKDLSIIAASVITGLLKPLSEEFNVNYINAFAMAKSRGIEVVTSASEDAGRFSNLIRVSLQTNGDSVSTAGTLTPDRGARIVEVNGSPVDIVPEGYFLLISHMDKPGMIGKVGTILGDTDINIASMEVARAQAKGPAMMILELDDDLPTPVLRKVREIKDLKSAISIKL